MGLQVLLAYLLDLLLGDPYWLPHPVRLVGRFSQWLEKRFRRKIRTSQQERLAGLFLLLVVAGLTFVLSLFLVKITFYIHPLVGLVTSVWLISATITTKGLNQAGQKVLKALERGELREAREKVGEIVSRDADSLSKKEIIRAAVESVAENTVDGVVAPIFYGLLGGAPLALLYRAVNTLDNMVGYKDERYRHFGWASARLDDFLNFIPARLNLILTFLTCLFLRKDGFQALKIGIKDGKRHQSPNSGLSEAAFAGALGIQLGGVVSHGGRVDLRPYFGSSVKPLSNFQLREALRLSYFSSLLMVSLGVVFTLI